MLTLGMDERQLERLLEALDGNAKKLPREITTAINATARKTKVLMSKQVRRELASTVKASYVKDLIKIGAKATPAHLQTKVSLITSQRLPLREFGARQNRRGTSYKISKTGGRKLATSAFQGPTPSKRHPTWNGRVFKRDGKARLPIHQLWGPSPWGVFVHQNYKPETVRETQNELRKQIERRINLNILRKQGTVR